MEWYLDGMSSTVALSFNHSCNSRLSATNCARIYNHTFAHRSAHIFNNPLAFPSAHHPDPYSDLDWQVSLEVRAEDVMNGFLEYSLLLDKAEHNGRLVLPHGGSQKDRLQPALDERNTLTEGTGQENYLHACDLCFIVFTDDDGRICKWFIFTYMISKLIIHK